MSLMTSSGQKRQRISESAYLNKIKIRMSGLELSLIDKIMLSITSIVCLGCGWGIIQANQTVMITENAIVQQVQESNRIKEQTQQILNSIADQYNYEKIKEAARQEGMTVDEDRVRSVK